jgi:predicted permease
MDAFWLDVRSAIRSLTKARGFTAVAVLVFALGIGINTALFSLTNALFFRDLPVERPDELVHIYDVNRYGRLTPAPERAAFEFFRDHGEVFASVTAHWPITLRLTVDEQTELTGGEYVESNYFDVLGVRAQRGRTFQPPDDAPSGATPMIISARLWERRFDADPGIIGRRVRLCCRPALTNSAIDPQDELEIVGVMPPGFAGLAGPLSASDFWVPAAWTGGDRIVIGLGPLARLKPGVSLEQGRAAVRQLGEVWLDDRRKSARAATIEAWRGRRFEARPAARYVNPFSPQDSTLPRQVLAMSVVVALVLVIAASNVAGLLTARAANRSGESAIRAVMGASQGRILRLMLNESVLLALGGGALGLLIANWLLQLFHAYAPSRLSIDARLDARVLAVTFAACLAAGLVAGFTPALRSARVNLLAVLPGSAATSPSHVRAWLRRVVLIPQVALSLALLTIAGFHVMSLMALETAERGYQTDGRAVLSVALRPRPGDTARGGRERAALRAREFYRQLTQRLGALDGVSGSAVGDALPLSLMLSASDEVISQDDFTQGVRAGVAAAQASVSPGYFRTMGLRLLSGREFDGRDLRLEGKNGSTIVPGGLKAIVSRALARRVWGDADPIGRSLALASTWPGNAGQRLDWMEVIGVVSDVHPVLDDKAEMPVVYRAMGQEWFPFPNQVVALAPGEAEHAVTELKRAVTGASVFAEVYRTQTLNQVAAELLFQSRMITGILAIAGMIGLALASVGLYGVISYSVAQRTRELGVRAALGASRVDVVRLVMTEGAIVAAIGMAAGGFLTFVALKAGVNTPIRTTVDTSILIVVPLALAAVITLACYIPARRAGRVDPLDSLRAL